MAVIEMQGIKRYYDFGEVVVKALDGLDLSIDSKEFVAIMGASGSGKSTLMNIMGCLDKPTVGNYRLDGIDTALMDSDRLSEIRNTKIGFVFQGFNLLPKTTALENVELPMLYNRRHKVFRPGEKAAAALERVGLGSRMHHVPPQLSGGQQQRVAIARALVNDPALILADEPTGNLDSETSLEIMSLFQELNDQGIMIVMVTHEPDIASFARRKVTVRAGRIVSDGPITGRQEAKQALSAWRTSHEKFLEGERA